MGKHNRKVIWQPHPGPQTKFLASSCYEVMYGGQAGGGKRLRVDEPIATPEGWTTMGDLQVGDLVFDADGQPVRVNWCSEVERNPDAWELEFSDGFRIECDAEHQWITLTVADREVGDTGLGVTRTTAEIVGSLLAGGKPNHSVKNPAPLDMPEVDLPNIEPGTIPKSYLRASIGQRVALLNGLRASYGNDVGRWRIQFDMPSVELRDGLLELLATLGLAPRCTGLRVKVSTDYGPHGRRYIVAARRVPPTPMRCIGVDSPTHSYLAGLPMVVTHNSESLIVGPLRYVHHPRFRAILFRNTFDDVVRSLGERSELLYPVVFPGAQYNRSDHTWTFPSGAKIYLRYLSSDHDALDHKSQEYQYIGFDELTTFTRHQYTYMLSRLRSSHGIPVQVRSGTNPGDRGHEWVFERFAAWLDPKHPNPAEPGEVRHYARVGDKTEEVPRGTVGARGRTFIRAALKDNPSLSVDYGYQLDDLDPVTRAQLKDGDWLVKPGRGKYFKREWVTVLSERPRDIVSTVRYWDFAGTSQKTEKHDPDWTAGVKMSMCSSGMVLVEHCDRYRGEPAEVEARTLQCAQLDGHIVRIGLEQDPGQAGKFQMRHFSRMLMGYTANAFPPTGDKVQRFGPFSAQAANGNVAVMQGEWTQEWLAELEQFPEGSHDDQVDATSGAFMMLQENRNSMMDLLMRMTAE